MCLVRWQQAVTQAIFQLIFGEGLSLNGTKGRALTPLSLAKQVQIVSRNMKFDIRLHTCAANANKLLRFHSLLTPRPQHQVLKVPQFGYLHRFLHP
jgi:hypothetical protein